MTMMMDTKKLNMTDKFILLEQLWDDMSQNVNDDRFTPNWHLEILNELEAQEKKNQLEFTDFKDVKKRLQLLVAK
jgi:hypothetical protein